MTAFPAGREFRSEALGRLLSRRLAINWELTAYLVIFAIAFALRFWDLGGRALHHDESIHAKWSWDLIQGDYIHSPVFHGPLYYHVQGFVFLIAGASDYTARLSAAIFGMGIVALPLLLRRRLGTIGTIAAMAFIAVSPTIVYFSRFFREDVYMAFFTIAMVGAMWQYIATRRDRWIIVFALAYAASHATKEATFITAAVFLVYLDVYVAADLARQWARKRDIETTWSVTWRTAIISPIAWALISIWPLARGLQQHYGWRSRLSPQGDLLIVLGTLSLPLLTRFLLDTPLLGRAFSNNNLAWDSVCRFTQNNASGGADALVVGGLFAVTMSGAALVGLNWRPRTWLIAFGGGAAIYLVLFSSLGSNPAGICTGAWGGLDYWIEQQNVRRGNQPWYYYSMLMPAYEFLVVALAVFGTYWAIFRGNAFSRFLVVWIAGMFLALSYAGEKMPWLNTHIALPTALLAGWTVNRAWVDWKDRPGARPTALALGSAAAIALGTIAVAAFLPDGSGGAPVRIVAILVGVALIGFAASSYGRQAVGAFGVAAIIGGLGIFSIVTMVNASFERGDVPKDLLIYTQSGPQIPELANRIDDLAAASGKGYELRIAVDGAESFAWPWAWYLRDYNNVNYANQESGVPNGEFDVIITWDGHEDVVTNWIIDSGISTYGEPVTYQHRIWFPESYKTELPGSPHSLSTWSDIGENVFNGHWLNAWGSFWLHHDPDLLNPAPRVDTPCASCGSIDGAVYFPAAFDPQTGEYSIGRLEPPGPSIDDAGRLTVGGFGSAPGQFIDPIDAATDGEGNLYVIDRARAVLQKFDPEGNVLATADLRADGSTSDAWGLTVAPNGTVIVADTFGWTVRLLDTELVQVRTIGSAPDEEIGAFDLFGPRDAAVDADGNIWVTDTGHDRIQVYAPDGEFLRTVGESGAGPGQLDEPVGLAAGEDGTIWVADMYNGRVQGFDASGNAIASFPVEGWGGREVENKPYIAALSGDRLAVTLPLSGEVRVYTAAGELLASINDGGQPLNRPYGLAEAPGDRLWIVESGKQRARLFDIPQP